MKKVIAHKKSSTILMFLLPAIFFFLFAIIGISLAIIFEIYHFAIFAIFLIFGIVFLVLAIRQSKIPNDLIYLSDNHHLILSDSTNVPLKDIIDVSYKNYTAKGHRYNWGTIIITTNDTKHKINNVDDCEDVFKVLTKLVLNEKII